MLTAGRSRWQLQLRGDFTASALGLAGSTGSDHREAIPICSCFPIYQHKLITDLPASVLAICVVASSALRPSSALGRY